MGVVPPASRLGKADVCWGRLHKLRLSCPHVTFVVPETLDKRPQGEFVPTVTEGAPGRVQGQMGDVSLPPTVTSPDPEGCGCAGRACFHTSRAGVGSRFSCPSPQLRKPPLAAAPPVNHEWRGRTAVGAGVNAWAAAGAARCRGDARVCVQGRHRQRAALEKKTCVLGEGT